MVCETLKKVESDIFQNTSPGGETSRFTAKELDSETGLYYYGARYLNPRTSKWISSDPAGMNLINPMDKPGKPKEEFHFIESQNWYSYVNNNPINYIDPTGKEAGTLTLGAATTVVAAGIWSVKMLTDDDFKEANVGLGKFIAGSLGKLGSWISDKILKKDGDTAENDESEGSTTMPSPDELKDKIKQAQEAVDAADNIIAPTPEMTPDQVESAREIENRLRNNAEAEGIIDAIGAGIKQFFDRWKKDK